MVLSILIHVPERKNGTKYKDNLSLRNYRTMKFHTRDMVVVAVVVIVVVKDCRTISTSHSHGWGLDFLVLDVKLVYGSQSPRYVHTLHGEGDGGISGRTSKSYR